MAELEGTENWEKARLIPIRGLKGGTAQEAAATSAVLAVMSIIPSFSRSLLRPLGAPAGRPETFAEPWFSGKAGDRGLQPDGLIRVTWGGKQWTALLEVKTGQNILAKDQIEAYVRLANQEGFDAMITISNEFVSPSLPHPAQISKKLLKNVQLIHWSWMHVLTTALALRRQKEVSDPEQAWLLDELIHYLGDERSGAWRFDGFGARWPRIREAARLGTLYQGSEGIREFVMRWDQFLRHLSLKLSGELGIKVEVVTSKAHRQDPEKRTRDLQDQLVADRQLDGVLRIPGAAADVHLSVYLHAQRIHASVTLKAPETKKTTSRINWLVRQIPNAPNDAQITARFKGRRSTSMLLADVRRDVKCLLMPDDPRDLPLRFTVAMDRPMGIKKGRGRGSFVASVEALVHNFYHDVVQELKVWVPPAPRIESTDREMSVERKAEDHGAKSRDGGGSTSSADEGLVGDSSSTLSSISQPNSVDVGSAGQQPMHEDMAPRFSAPTVVRDRS
ncbi:MAG: hypothetical protein OXG19_04725 [Chloroflexi bacterium]|nr:hypothetical protein [Chloroflexota bacterium]